MMGIWHMGYEIWDMGNDAMKSDICASDMHGT